MQGVKRCQESTGRMKKHRYSNEFKVTGVKRADAQDIVTKAIAEALSIPPSMGRTVATHAELESPPAAYVRFYDHRRQHSATDHQTPEDKERLVA